jgi:hypothetical protein
MLNSFAKAPRQQASQTVTVAAPIGGWNARDALGAMDPLDAVTLQMAKFTMPPILAQLAQRLSVD